MGPNLMLVLIAPNPDPGWTGFDAGFHRAQNGVHFGALKIARQIQHIRWHAGSGVPDNTPDRCTPDGTQIALSSSVPDDTPASTSDPAFQTARLMARLIHHVIFSVPDSTPDPAFRITHLIQRYRSAHRMAPSYGTFRPQNNYPCTRARVQ